MHIRVISDDGKELWVKGETGGVMGLPYRRGGALDKLIAELESALKRALEAQVNIAVHSVALLVSDEVSGMLAKGNMPPNDVVLSNNLAPDDQGELRFRVDIKYQSVAFQNEI